MREIKQITINGKKFDLRKDQVICFVGPNSSGKSSALEAIYNQSLGKSDSRPSAIDSIEVAKFDGKEELLQSLKGKVKFSGGSVMGYDFSKSWGGGNLAEDIVSKAILNQDKTEFNQIFQYFINAKNRFQGVDPVQNIDFNKNYPRHPFHHLYKYPSLERRLSDISKNIFGVELSLNPGAGINLQLHLGTRINPEKFGGNRSQEYANELADLPLIEVAGDGYKAAIGLTGQILSSDASALFVDEPDLYLHPPQAFQLAKTFCREKAKSQLFFSTHSARFAQGLFEESANRLILIRLMKAGDEYISRIIDSEVFKEIRNDPVLKFSQISEGMFYENTFLCEDSSDCLFYQFARDKMGYEEKEGSSLWIGVNGKTNFCKVARTARKLGLSPICIADFDILSKNNDSYKSVLKPLIEIVSDSANEEISALIDQIVMMVDQDNSINWDQLKTMGLEAMANNKSLYEKSERLLQLLRQIGIIIVPFGEVESLHAPRLGKGMAAINQMLEKNINDDGAMSKARSFIESSFGKT